MYNYIFDPEKNEKLKTERGISFEMVIQAIEEGKFITTLQNKNEKYKNQSFFIVNINSYAFVVLVVINKEKQEITLKTIYPNRKMTKIYLGEKNVH